MPPTIQMSHSTQYNKRLNVAIPVSDWDFLVGIPTKIFVDDRDDVFHQTRRPVRCCRRQCRHHHRYHNSFRRRRRDNHRPFWMRVVVMDRPHDICNGSTPRTIWYGDDGDCYGRSDSGPVTIRESKSDTPEWRQWPRRRTIRNWWPTSTIRLRHFWKRWVYFLYIIVLWQSTSLLGCLWYVVLSFVRCCVCFLVWFSIGKRFSFCLGVYDWKCQISNN